MTESLSRERLEAIHFDRLSQREMEQFEKDGWRYQITVTLEAFSPQRAPKPILLKVKSYDDSETFEGSITLGRQDRRHFAELLVLLASKLKYDQLRGVSNDAAGFLHSKEVIRLSDAHLTKVPKSLYSSIGALYRDSGRTGSGARDFLHRLFAYPQQMWHLICRCGITAGKADEEDLVWWLNVGPDALVFQDVSGNPVDDGQLERSLAKLFPKKHLLKPAECHSFVKNLGLDSPLRAGIQSDTYGLSREGESGRADRDEWCPRSDRTALEPRSGAALRYELLRYLRDLARECARLPRYFPMHLRGNGSDSDAFDTIRQEVRIIEDRTAFQKWLAEELERLRRAGIAPEVLLYSPGMGLPGERNEYEHRSILWNEWASKNLRHVTILGDPGLGKSWLLRYEAKRAAWNAIERMEERSGNLDDIDIPIFVWLPEAISVSADGFEDVAVALGGRGYSKECQDYMRRQIRAGRAVLLLDAWDEVVDLDRRRALNRLIHRMSRYSTRIMLTSRNATYDMTEPPLLDGKEVELLPWHWRQIESFVRVWFGSEERKAEDVLFVLQTDFQFRGLAKIPLMLQLLCQACLDLKCVSRRSELYEKCLNQLFRDWHIHDKEAAGRYSYTQLSESYVNRVMDALERVAMDLQEGGERKLRESDIDRIIEPFLNDVYCDRPSHVFTRKQIGAEDIIKRVKEDGVMVRDCTNEQGALVFLHKTFQEYLAARALAKRADCISVALAHVCDSGWHQVLAILGGVLTNSGPYIAALLRRNKDDLLCRPLLLAVKALAETKTGEIPEEVVGALAGEVAGLRLFRRMGFLWPEVEKAMYHFPRSRDLLTDLMSSRRSAAKTLSKLRSSGAWHVLNSTRDNGEICIDGAMNALLSIYYTRHYASPLALVPRSLEDLYRDDARKALDIMADMDPKDVDAWLAQGLRSRDREEAQLTVSVLAEMNSEEAMYRLIEAVCDMSHYRHARMPAARALGERHSDEAALVLLKVASDRNDDEQVRLMAIRALSMTKSNKALCGILRIVRAEDTPKGIRHAAAETLGEAGFEEAIPVLVQSLEDSDFEMRIVASRALLRIRPKQAIPVTRVACAGDGESPSVCPPTSIWNYLEALAVSLDRLADLC